MGWSSQIPWKDEFGYTSSDLASEPCYEEWNTDIAIHPVRVPSGVGVARLQLSSPYGLSGVVTSAPGGPNDCPQPVPSAHFRSGVDYRNKWTAVTDFYAKAAYQDRGAHNAIFIRVHNDRRYWDPDIEPDGGWRKETTRFGCFLRGEPRTGTDPGQGCLQLYGDKIRSNPNDKLEQSQFKDFFELSEDPFDHPNDKYRVQIIEEQKLSVLRGWEGRWVGEIWNLTRDRRIGRSSVMTELALKNDHRMVIPGLDESRLSFALGPGTGGRCDVDFVATNYWQY